MKFIKSTHALSILFISQLVFLAACSDGSGPGNTSGDGSGSTPGMESSRSGSFSLTDNPGSESVLPGGEVLGVHVSDYNDVLQLSFYDNSGAIWSRYDRFHWDLIESIPQNPPVYDWSSVDETGLLNAAKRGILVTGIVLFTPDYAQKLPGSVCGPISEDQLSRFGDFLHALVQRYSQEPYHVKYWEIGNEPDVNQGFASRVGFGCWGDPADPGYGGGYYAEMLNVAYPRIKSVDPQAQVLIGGLLLDCDPRNPPKASADTDELKDCSPARFLDGILANGGGDYFDGISFHAYDYYEFQDGKYSNYNWGSSSSTNGVVSIPKTSFLLERLQAYGVSDKYLLNTESGLVCGSDGKEEGCQSEAFTQTKAAYIVHTNTTALSLGLRANIWYSLMGWRGSELVSEHYRPLAAFDTFQVNFRFLQQANFNHVITNYPQFFVYEFDTPQGSMWVVWSKSGQPEPIQLPAQPRAVYDMYGTLLPANQNLSVDFAPLYIQF